MFISSTRLVSGDISVTTVRSATHRGRQGSELGPGSSRSPRPPGCGAVRQPALPETPPERAPGARCPRCPPRPPRPRLFRRHFLLSFVRDSEMRGVTIRLHLPQSRLPGRPQPGAVAVPSHDPRPQTHVCGPHPAPTLRIGAPRGLTDGATGPSDERLSAQHVRPELTSGLPHRRRPICLAVLRDGMSGVASCVAQSLGITPGFSFFRLVISRLEVALTLLSTHTRKPTQPSPSHHSL